MFKPVATPNMEEFKKSDVTEAIQKAPANQYGLSEGIQRHGRS